MAGLRLELPDAAQQLVCGGLVALQVTDLEHGVRAVRTTKTVAVGALLAGAAGFDVAGTAAKYPWTDTDWEDDRSVVHALPADRDAVQQALTELAVELHGRRRGLCAELAISGGSELADGFRRVLGRDMDGDPRATRAFDELPWETQVRVLDACCAGDVRQLRELVCRSVRYTTAEQLDEFLGDHVFYDTARGRVCLPRVHGPFVISARACAEDRWYLLACQPDRSWFCVRGPEGLDTQDYAPLDDHDLERYRDAGELAAALAGRARFEDGTRPRMAFMLGRVFAPELPGRGVKDNITISRLAGVEQPTGWVQATPADDDNEYDYANRKPLERRAQQRGIKGRSKLDVDELRAALAEHAVAHADLSAALSSAGAFVRSSLSGSDRKLLRQSGVQAVKDSLLLEALYAHRLGAGFCHAQVEALTHRLPEQPDTLVAWRPISPFTGA